MYVSNFKYLTKDGILPLLKINLMQIDFAANVRSVCEAMELEFLLLHFVFMLNNDLLPKDSISAMLLQTLCVSRSHLSEGLLFNPTTSITWHSATRLPPSMK
jgi:hypothetical protein